MQHLSDCTRDGDEACCCPDLTYEVVQDKILPGDWRAEAIDHEGEGECYVVIFCGYDSEARAREYAQWKNSGGEIVGVTVPEEVVVTVVSSSAGQTPEKTPDGTDAS